MLSPNWRLLKLIEKEGLALCVVKTGSKYPARPQDCPVIWKFRIVPGVLNAIVSPLSAI